MTGLRESVLKGRGVMNFCASPVMTTRTLQPAFVSNDARSAALCAAIEPVTPRTTWDGTLILLYPTQRQLGEQAVYPPHYVAAEVTRRISFNWYGRSRRVVL